MNSDKVIADIDTGARRLKLVHNSNRAARRTALRLSALTAALAVTCLAGVWWWRAWSRA